ncbi:MAG: hypothetical protein JW896_08850 [Deltaproteobacteria bacterium]|nr:hypothetical protein [Deltaproteobacteria bacterium]
MMAFCLTHTSRLSYTLISKKEFLSILSVRFSHLAEARASGKKGVELSAGASVPVARLVCIRYQAGESSRGDEVFAELKKRSEEAYVALRV